MREMWQNRENNATYTRSKSGAMSTNGRTAGGSTWSMTPKNDDGTPVLNTRTGEARQSGRSKLATRSQRNYDVRAGLNNITQKAMDAMIRTGQVRVVDGNMVGEGGNIITRKSNGNYTMGLSVG